MGQSAIPDVNSKFLIYTREALNGWKNGNYDEALGALYTFNRILPDDDTIGHYRVLVDTEEYTRRTKGDLVVICESCSKNCKHCQGNSTKEDNICIAEFSYDSIKKIDVLLPLVNRIISGVNSEKIWICQTCKNENLLSQTKIIQKILKEPSSICVVPRPPTRKDGIIDRSQFHTKFTVWFWTFISELEGQAARFRQNYKPKEGEDNEFIETIEGREHQDI